MESLARSASCASCASIEGRRCRLCWASAEGGQAGQLISPCKCKGSMEFIHFGCLQHWLEVTRQQGRSRQRSIHCEICKSKYNTSGMQFATGDDGQQLLPGFWQDPYTVAAAIHGTYRACVAVSGLLKAYLIYRSIQDNAPTGVNVTAHSSIGSSCAALWPAQRLPQQQQQQQLEGPLRHLSVNIPLSGSRQAVTKEALAAIRERFDSATLVQVYWYTSLIALLLQPPNADAFAGMALGATIGGMIAQLVFLPMLGSGKLAALCCSCRLLSRCLVRLFLAHACQARGYRVLAAAVRRVMQGRRGLQLQLRRRLQWLGVPARQVVVGEGRAVGAEAAAQQGGEDGAVAAEAAELQVPEQQQQQQQQYWQ